MAADNPKSARRWGWAILLLTSSISLAFNIGHAVGPTAAAHTVPVPLAVLYGVAPVLVALMLSHLIAIQQGGWLKRALTGVVFIAAMALSVRAIYEVLEPIAGRWGLLFAAMLDLASLLALNEVLAGTPAATASSPATSGVGSGGPERNAPPNRHVPASQQARQTATPPATSGRQKATSAAPRSGTGGARAASQGGKVAAPTPARQTPASTTGSGPAHKNDAVPHTARSQHNGTASTATALTNRDPSSTNSSGGARPPEEAMPLAPPAPATRSATSGATPSRLVAPPHRHTATTEEAATPNAHIGTATSGRHNARQLATDWRTLLTEDDVAAAATAFVRHRDAEGKPRRGAGTEFAELAQQQGSDLSMRQLRDYITKACKLIDQHADQQTA